MQSFTLVVFAGKIMRIIFFGELRAAEFEVITVALKLVENILYLLL